MATSFGWLERASAAHRYILAVLVFLLALGLRFLVLPVEAGLAYTTFYPAVFLTYYFLGVGPGVLVMVLSACFGYYIFQPPYWSFDFNFNGATITATFLLSNSLIGWLTSRHIKALIALQASQTSQKVLHKELEVALSEAKDMYSKAPFGYYSLNPDGRIVQANEKFLGWVQANEQDVIGVPISDFFDPDGRAAFGNNFTKFKKEGHIENLEFNLVGRSGCVRKVSVSATALVNEKGDLIKSRSVMFDLTELSAAKERIEDQRRLLEGVIEGLPFGVALFDDNQILQSYNKGFVQLLGYQDEVLRSPGFCFADLIRMNVERGDYGGQPWEAVYGHLSALMKQRQGTNFERPNQDGKWLEISAVSVFDGWTLITYNDITKSKNANLELERAKQLALNAAASEKLAQEEAQYIAYHDSMTGLPNRRLFADRAEQAIAVATRHDSKLAICYLDLDGFKSVNDAYGHEEGDKLLITIAKRLTECVRAQDTVCRLGGDEFVLLLTSFETEDEIQTVLQRVLAEVADPVPLYNGVNAEVSVSIGYTLFPKDATEKGILMRLADHAMYEAKRRGKNRIQRHQVEQLT